MKVAIIGAGSLGQSIAKGLLTNKVLSSLYLTKRNTNSIKSFSNYNEVILTSDNSEAVKNADILIFAVQPRHFEKILTHIKPLLKENHLIISVITGFSIAKIEAIVGSDKNIIRSMPNTAASSTPACSSKQDSTSAAEIFSPARIITSFIRSTMNKKPLSSK